MGFTVGCVPYLNAVPLVHAFEELGSSSPVRVIYDVPSNLPSLLDSGIADAIMVSSVDCLRIPGRRISLSTCIASQHNVDSVRLFSKVPFGQIRSLAWDQSSMTSNRLAMILLQEVYGVEPDFEVCPPDLNKMLASHDACILIGDLGMAAIPEGLHVMDLGGEWRNLTGKPFLWAGWIGGEGLTPELTDHLIEGYQRAMDDSGSLLPAVIDAGVKKSRLPRAVVERYLTETMDYEFGLDKLCALHCFQEHLLACGFVDAKHTPDLVMGARLSVGTR